MASAHRKQAFLFAYRGNRLLRSFGEKLPSNAGRSWLHAAGIAPRTCKLFHGLNQRIDSKFPRSAATFHDLFVLTGEYSSPEFRQRFAAQARGAAERADLLIAVSEFTASQITGLLGVERSRIRVIHHGVRRAAADQPPGARRRNMILHVGAIQTRKNLARLVHAFEQVPAGWKLVLVGSLGYGAGVVLDQIRSSRRLADIELPGYATNEQLEALYAEAAIFAFPSLDEGFGMPVLEAMARGIPVITSNGSALAEVAAEAAMLVDPRDAESLGGALRKMALDEDLRQGYGRRGLVRAAEFSWEKAVSETWKVYSELL